MLQTGNVPTVKDMGNSLQIFVAQHLLRSSSFEYIFMWRSYFLLHHGGSKYECRISHLSYNLIITDYFLACKLYLNSNFQDLSSEDKLD